jgi:prepilin-type N-terminal cleavage/methylation domain-containing protein/prepilin-type processing-associated H-X9-DG protein
MNTRQRRNLSQGFTLTELLVVILIIVVLAALGMTGIRKFRDMADKTSAIRTLSQIQIANVSYSTDNNGKYIPFQRNDDKGVNTFWHNNPDFLTLLLGELPEENGKPVIPESVLESVLDPKVVRAKKASWNRIFASFGQNIQGLPAQSNAPNFWKGYTTQKVTQPARSMAFATATDRRVVHGAHLKWFSRDAESREGKTSDGGLAYRHGNKTLVVFFDGHVAEISKGDMEKIDNQGRSNNVFWDPEQ